ncbi:MAG: phosphonate C-P lyase system protein PhnL [Proteobacteria bacterium]|nr:phosphonate C-P lyase system protein PhnL [Pseudomonadota bacterium]MDA1073054.1 phosphonate C-P lyase system protein PhnL [Pseudomonadota bacterium]
MTPMIAVKDLSKTFVLHLQGSTRLPVFDAVSFEVAAGECLALVGPSGAGKSTLLRSLYGNYRPDGGSLAVRHEGGAVDLMTAEPRTVLTLRRRTIGHVSQFLRVIPRVATLDVVAEPAIALGEAPESARARAAALLERLNIAPGMHGLAPATFSGGEQQRVNVARGFLVDYPVLLLDEPTASLDTANRDVVVDLILEARARGAAVVGIFHDAAVRDRVADRCFDLSAFRTAA